MKGWIQNLQGGGAVPPVPFLSPFLSLYPLPVPYPLDSGSLKPATGSGVRCKLHQWGTGRAPTENKFGAF